MKLLCVWSVLMVAAIGSGCAHEPRTQDAPMSANADPLGRGPESATASEGLKIDLVFPFILAHATGGGSGPTKQVARFEVVDGPHEGKVLLLSQQHQPGTMRWDVVRRLEGADQPLERRVQEIRTAENAGEGTSCYLVEFWNDERGVRVVFEPDPLTMPARLEALRTVTTTQKITLPTIVNPRRIRERGTGQMDLTYEADQEITTKAGTFACARTREVYTSRLKNATAVRTIDRWYAPGVGLVAERWEEKVTIFGGIVAEQTVHAMRLIGLPADEASTSPGERPTGL